MSLVDVILHCIAWHVISYSVFGRQNGHVCVKQVFHTRQRRQRIYYFWDDAVHRSIDPLHLFHAAIIQLKKQKK